MTEAKIVNFLTMAENVKVIVRCRPMNKKELDLKCKVSDASI